MAKINSINNASYALTSDTTLTATLGNITATNGSVVITAGGNLSLPTAGSTRTSGVITVAGACVLHNYRARNIFLGEGAGGAVNYDSNVNDNTGVGYNAMNGLQAGYSMSRNTAVGAYAGTSFVLSNDCDNTAVGYKACYITGGNSGLQNTAVGSLALSIQRNQYRNTAIGYKAGYAYYDNAHDNLCLNSQGVSNETYTLHIGESTGSSSDFQLKTAYICGIYTTAATPSGTAKVTLVDNANVIYGLTNTTGALLHVAAAGTAPIWSVSPTVTSILATTFDTNVAAAAVTLAGTTLAADGSDTDISITITPKGAGVLSTGNITSTAVYAQAVGGTNRAMLVDDAGVIGNATSSIRFKDNVKDMGHRSDDLMKLRPVTFSYKSDESKREKFGLIAEEVAQVYPGLVSYDENNEPYTVSYHELPALLLNEIQKLHKKIEQLEARLNLQQKGE